MQDTDFKGPKIVVPVVFLDETPLKLILVDEPGAWKLCSLDKRSPQGARKAFQRIRTLLNIKPFPGFLFSYEEIQRKVREYTLVKQLVRRAGGSPKTKGSPA